MQRIIISFGPCRKLVLTKCGVSELEVDNIMFLILRQGNAFWFEFPRF